MATSKSGDGSGRCVCCSLCCAILKIACFSCARRLCPCCFRPPSPPRKEFSVICLGLQGAGKTTLLSRLTGEEDAGETGPTMGFSITDIITTRAVLHVKEVGGSEKIRPYWDKYYSGQQAIIYVLDSTALDDEQLEAALALERSLSDTNLAGLPLLVLCNKQDLANATSLDKLQEKLQLDRVARGRSFAVRSCSAWDVVAAKATIESLVSLLVQSGAGVENFTAA